MAKEASKGNPKFQQAAEELHEKQEADFDVFKEEKRVADSIKKGADATTSRTAIVNAEIEELRNQNKEKGYDLKKKPSHEMKSGNNNEEELKTELRYTEEANLRTDRRNNAESGVLDMEKAKEQYEQTLKAYAEVEYKHRSTFKGIAKFFGKSFNGKADDNFEVKEERKRMEDDLRVYRDAWIRDIQNKELKGEDLKAETEKMMVYFNYQAAIDLYDARSGAKANSLWPFNKESKQSGKNVLVNYDGFDNKDVYKKENVAEKTEIKARDILCTPFKAAWAGMEKIGQQYNRLPIWAKLGLGAAIIGSGSWALIAGKRVLGGVTTAVGSAKTLDALHQRSMKNKATKENEAFMGVEGKENKEVDFEKLRALLDDKIGQIDGKMNEYKIASLFNKFAGAGIGLFLGSGMASKAFGGAFGKVAEYFQNGKDAVDGVNGSFNGAILGANVNTPLTDAMDHPKGPPTNFVDKLQKPFDTAEALSVSAGTESLTIEKGSSIEGTLIKYYKEHGLNFKDNGWAADHAYKDYMHDYIENHKDELTKSGKLAEYQKMLKDGMVNVKPGTEIVIDPNTGHIVSIDGKLSHLDGHHSVGGGGVENGQSVGNDISKAGSEITTNGSNIANAAVENAGWNAEALENQNATVEQLGTEYGRVLNEIGDGGVMQSNYIDERILRTALEDAKNNLKEITNNPNGDYGGTLRNILKAFSDKNIAEWNRIEKIEVTKFLVPEGSQEMGNMSQDARATIGAYGKLMPPKKGKLMGKWVIRFMQAAKDGLIKK
ncbi:MAG: hypothetical protein PHP62_02540 [Candidatus Moranbacteria bacterium]|nr:hypothetical protein [Candidatus Moranbacteria bacterium]